MRRRIFLMRHGSVDYFDADGRPLESASVALNEAGREQADAAGSLMSEQNVQFDLVVTSGLPRTIETARRVLAACGQSGVPREDEPALAEILDGDLDSIGDDVREESFTRVFLTTGDVEGLRYLAGETIGEMLDRVLPAFDALLARKDWDCLLLVLHGGVNRALLSRALMGQRAFLGRFEQAPACINIVDVGPRDLIVRATNLAPTQWLHGEDRRTSMEKFYAEYEPQRGSA
ncbi:MAG: histidine phosphatase family protein [Burkholderiaceae bacterium]